MQTLKIRTMNDGPREPVRRHSYLAGACEGRIWAPFDGRDARRFMLAAERYELHTRPAGRRCGMLGHVALEILREMLRLVDYRTGRLEPSISTIQGRLKRSRAAVVRGLASLRLAGFLDWIRRFEPVQAEGAGPRIKQASNAYRLSLPPLALRLLGLAGRPAPVSADLAAGYAARRQETAHGAFEESPLGAAFAVLQRRILERESAKRSESAASLFEESCDGKICGVGPAARPV